LAQGNVHKLTTRLQGLDSLRGMAALAVVLYHYTFGYTQVVGRHMPGLDLIATDGHFGIYLFFIISGFVIFMTLERSARAADFSVSRFARLWPPYLVCAGLTSLLIVGLDFNPNHLTVVDALLNILMMNKVLGNVSIDPSYWTLTYEVLFYASAAMIFFGLKIKRIEWACLAWLGLAFVARISSFNQHHQRLGVVLGVDFCHFFVLGMMIYLISQRRNSWLTMSTTVLAFAMTLFGPSYNPGAIKLWQFMLLTALFAGIVWLVAERKIRFLNIAPLLFLGEISYSLYLVHQIAGYWVIKQLEALGWDPDHAIWAAVLCAIVVATCVRKWVEVPAQKAIRGWYQETGKQFILSSSPS
jgi:peptidoglycan/LPS O-acetylase OafA/YrhL